MNVINENYSKSVIIYSDAREIYNLCDYANAYHREFWGFCLIGMFQTFLIEEGSREITLVQNLRGHSSYLLTQGQSVPQLSPCSCEREEFIFLTLQYELCH